MTAKKTKPWILVAIEAEKQYAYNKKRRADRAQRARDAALLLMHPLPPPTPKLEN